MKTFFAITLFLISTSIFAQVPSDIQAQINELPDKTLKLDFVIAAAMKSTSSFKLVQLQKIKSESSVLLSEAAFDWRLTASTSIYNSKNESYSPLSPTETKSNSYGLGVSKYFASGTLVSADFSQSRNELEMNPEVDPFYENKINFSISQNLMKDAFGKAQRSQNKSLKVLAQAQELEQKEAVHQWTLEMIQLYYGAWFSKQQYLAAEANLKRREELLNSTKIKVNRGTAEKADLLQVQSALLMAKNSFLNTESDLQDKWRRLVIALQFPEKWLAVPAKYVPIMIDLPTESQFNICTQEDSFKKALSYQKSQLFAQSANFNYEKSISNSQPDLKLNASLTNNAIDERLSKTLDDSLSSQNPAWSIGLVLTIPLEASFEKSQVASSYLDKMNSEVNNTQVLDLARSQILYDCADQKTKKVELENAKMVLKNQTDRFNEEKKRFNLGRVPTFNVIQAGDDVTNAELYLNQIKIAERLNFWKLKQHQEQIISQLEEWAKKYE